MSEEIKPLSDNEYDDFLTGLVEYMDNDNISKIFWSSVND